MNRAFEPHVTSVIGDGLFVSRYSFREIHTLCNFWREQVLDRLVVLAKHSPPVLIHLGDRNRRELDRYKADVLEHHRDLVKDLQAYQPVPAIRRHQKPIRQVLSDLKYRLPTNAQMKIASPEEKSRLRRNAAPLEIVIAQIEDRLKRMSQHIVWLEARS